jgi:uncharacterized damage-inducible protein DinB
MTSPSTTADPLTSETPYSLLFSDLEQELATTRRILERVPDGKEDWRPHDKSMTLGKLSSHVAQLPGFGIMMLTTDEFDRAAGAPPDKLPSNTADRLALFDDLSAKLLSLVQNLTWDDAMRTWRFRFGDRVVANGPRAKLIRTMVITHLAHHRAQLGVYLRLLGVPIPGSYGPSADEPVPR